MKIMDSTPEVVSTTPLPNLTPQFEIVPHRALRQNVVASLLKAIFRGQIGEGDWLNAQKLAANLGVSATPVREALGELAIDEAFSGGPSPC